MNALLSRRNYELNCITTCPRGVMVKALDCRIVVSEFKLQSRYYVHFWTNTLGKGMNALLSRRNYELNCITTCPRGVMVKALDCRIVVSEFKLQSRYYVHFWTNTLGKGMNAPLSRRNYELNCITTCPRGVMVKALDCRIVVSEFKLQSRCYVHFRTNTLGKGMNSLIPPAMG